MRKVPGGVFSNWINEHAAARRHDAGDGAARAASSCRSTPQARAPLPRHRRRQRHHADPLDHEDGAGARAAVALHADLRQPHAALDDVQGGARGPEEPLPDAAGAAPRVLRTSTTDAPLNSGRDRPREDRRVPRRAGRPGVDRPCLRLRPAQVNDEAEAALLAAGVPAERIHIERFGIPRCRPARSARCSTRRGQATPSEARITIIRDGLQREIDFHARPAATSSTPPPPPGSRCRSRARRASAAPAAPSCSKARCAWSATSRSRSTRSRPASC